MGIVELGERDLVVELVVEFWPGGEAVSSLAFLSHCLKDLSRNPILETRSIRNKQTNKLAKLRGTEN